MKTYNLGASNLNNRRYYVRGLTTLNSGKQIEFDDWKHAPKIIGSVEEIHDGRIEWLECADIGPKPKILTEEEESAREKAKDELGFLVAFISAPHGRAKFTRRLAKLHWMEIHENVWAVPCRLGPGAEHALRDITPHVPPAANIRTIFITDRQWGESKTLIGKNYEG